jgi:hypothetical protein
MGTMSTTFQYATIDAIGQQAAASSSYTVTWALALPLKITSFDITPMGQCKVHAAWQAEEDDQLDHYTIEQSTNGTDFTGVADMQPKGGTGNMYGYDFNSQQTNAYFRLKMINKSGGFIYSTVLYRTDLCRSTDVVSIYPNPASDQIEVRGAKAGSQLIIYDGAGRALITKKLSANDNTVIISKLPAGVYPVSISGETGKTLKLIKK